MKKDRSWKKADYDNAKPCWQKNRIKYKKKETQLERVLKSLDWDKLATIGKYKEVTNENTIITGTQGNAGAGKKYKLYIKNEVKNNEIGGRD